MTQTPKTELAAHLSAEELKQRYRSCRNAKEARRWHILWLCSTGMPIGEIATTVGLHRNWVRIVIQRYNASGAEAVVDQHATNPGGRRPALDTHQEQALAAALQSRPADGGRWTGPKVAAWIGLHTNRSKVPPQLGWVYLRKLGLSPQVPRPRHRDAASADEQDAWKKIASTITTIQHEHPQAAVEVWAQDESRLGLKPVMRRVWAPVGQRPLADSAHRFDWLYVYGFVQPQTGKTEWLILPTVRTDVMGLALSAFAKAIGAGVNKQVILVLDQAGWHTSAALQVPEGLHLVALPSHTPELQPAERLWPLLREAVANDSFADLDELEIRLSERCRALAADPSTVHAHTAFHWWPHL